MRRPALQRDKRPAQNLAISCIFSIQKYSSSPRLVLVLVRLSFKKLIAFTFLSRPLLAVPLGRMQSTYDSFSHKF